MSHPYIEKTENGRLKVRTPYVKELTTRLKLLKGYWNTDEKAWFVPEAKEAELETLLAEFFPKESVTPDTEGKSLMSILDRCVSDRNYLYGGDTVERLISFAYYAGREAATKEVSDAYRTLIREMRQRAEKSRYKALLNEVIGQSDYIVLEEYKGHITKELGSLKTDLIGD